MNVVAQPESGRPNLLAMLAMGEGDSKLRRAMTAYATAAAVIAAGRVVWKRVAEELTFTVTVDSADEIYPDVHAWVLDRVPPGRQRSLVARSRRSDQLVSDRPAPPEQPLTLFYDGRRSQTVRLGSHRCRVVVEQEDAGLNDKERDGWGSFRRDRVVFTTLGVPARDAILEVLRGMSASRNSRREVRLYGPGWGDWTRISELPTRTLDSVILRAGQKEAVVDDLTRFLASETAYNRLGLPWHRGYLLTGPPGTGKTSMARVLAQHFTLDVYYLPLASVPNDGSLSRMLGAVPPRSMLLIEDVDIAHGARQRDDSEPGVTLSGLLNGLDGVMTPHGLITVLTTNDETVLDPALIRAGRVDRTFHLDYLDNAQFAHLVAFAMGPDRRGPLPSVSGMQVTPADVVEALKPHLDAPGEALAALHALVASRAGGVGRPAGAALRSLAATRARQEIAD